MCQILYGLIRILYSWKQMLAAATVLTFLFYGLVSPSFATPAPVDDWKELQRRGIAALDANEYWLAEPLLNKALAQADKAHPKDIRLAKSLGELGRLYSIRGRFDEAEAYLEEQLSIEKTVYEDDKSQCIPTMGFLIRFYLLHGTQSKALPLTAELLYFVEGKLDEVKAGSVKLNLQKGAPLQGWAGVASQTMRQPAIEWAIACDAVGNCYLQAGNADNLVLADRLFKAALDVKTTVLGKDHLSLANSYDSLGSLYLEKNDLHEAESYFADAFEITEKTLQASHETYNRLDKLAKCLIREEKYQQAEDLYRHAQSFWKSETSTSGDQARAQYALGSLYVQEHKYDQAEPLLQQALVCAEKFNGPDSITVVPYLQKYAYVLYYLGRKPEMEQLQARATTISAVSM